MCVVALAGCGGSGSPRSSQPVATRVCARAGHAARSLLGTTLGVTVIDRDPANIQCSLQAAGTRVEVTAEASPRAWTEYDTVTVHQVQAYGSGPARDVSQLPLPVAIPGAAASWIAAQGKLVATNGSPSAGGSFVTVTVSGASAHVLPLAHAVARATLASAPRGPSPGPPPS